MSIAPLRPGDPARVGPCRLLGRLGQGGMGTVFLGVTADDRAVAVKVLRDGVSDAEARRRFRHELAALQRVRGPHLVEVLEADVEADTPYIVTRFVPGRRLDVAVAEDGPLPEHALVRVARGIASGLAVLHAAGVVHRDLTPGNVLLVDGEPHVIDLGLAVAADVTALTRSGTVLGTPGYLAPEQVVGTACTSAADVHAWGATVALAGTGRPPYGTGRPEAVLYRVVHDRPDLAGLPHPLADLVARATSTDPSRRPTARALVEALGGPSDTEPVTVVLPPGTTPEQAQTTRLDPAVLAAARGPVTTRLPTVAPAGDAPTTVSLPVLADPEAGRETTRLETGRLETSPVATAEADTAQLETAQVETALRERGDGERPNVRGSYVGVTSALGLVTTGALACVRPVAVALLATLCFLALQATARASVAREVRQARRGDRRRDAAVSTLALPWHGVRAAGDLLRAVPVATLLVGPPVLAVLLLADDPPGRSTPGAAAVAVGVVGGLVVVLSRAEAGRARRRLRRGVVGLAPDGRRTALVVGVLGLVALLAVAAPEQVTTSWWPLPRG